MVGGDGRREMLQTCRGGSEKMVYPLKIVSCRGSPANHPISAGTSRLQLSTRKSDNDVRSYLGRVQTEM